MQYEVTHKIYGAKMVMPSEMAKDHFLKDCKKDKKGQIAWKVSRELKDGPAKPQYSIEELERMLMDAKGSIANEAADEVGVEVKKRGRPKQEVTQDA